MPEKLWVVYDERAMTDDSHECAVLESCSSLHEAMHEALAGVVFEYDVTADRLVNERKIGPNEPLKRVWRREEPSR